MSRIAPIIVCFIGVSCLVGCGGNTPVATDTKQLYTAEMKSTGHLLLRSVHRLNSTRTVTHCLRQQKTSCLQPAIKQTEARVSVLGNKLGQYSLRFADNRQAACSRAARSLGNSAQTAVQLLGRINRRSDYRETVSYYAKAAAGLDTKLAQHPYSSTVSTAPYERFQEGLSMQ